MRTSFVAALFGAVLFFPALCSVASAQYYGGGYGGGGGWGGGYGHASTVEEGAQRGFADVVRSAGAANLMNSVAAGNYEDARKKYIENRLQATQTYFEMRRTNDEARAAERPKPLSSEQYVRLARQQAPDRLSVSQLDPLSGTITWSQALRRDEYKEERAALDKLYKERAAGVASNYDEIEAALAKFKERLKGDIAKMEPNDFIRGNKFLDSLSYELKMSQH